MKVIILNESQFRKLLEQSGNGDSQFLDGNDTIKRFSSEVSNQTIVHDKNGNEKMSKPLKTDKFSKQQTPQQWGSVGGRKSSNTI